MRTAAILALGFIAVFVVSLVAAPGSEGPPPSSTHSCGSYVAGRPHGRHVAYATQTDCARARRVALTYTASHLCRRGASCRAAIDGLDCRYAGAAGRGLGWMVCGHSRQIHAPRVFFSVEHPGPAAAEGPNQPALPS